MNKGAVAKVLKWTVSLGLIAIILSRVDMRGLGAAIRDVDVAIFAIALVVMSVGLFLRALKWRVLLKVHGADANAWTLYRTIFISLFFNNFFLGALGGDAFRLYETFGDTKTKGGAASAIILDRATGFIVALLMVIIFGTLLALTYRNLVSLPLFVAICITALVAAVTLAAVVSFEWWIHRVPVVRNWQRVLSVAEDVAGSLRAYRHHGSTLAAALALSVVFQFVQAVTVLLFVIAANADVSFIGVLFISPLVGLLAAVPVSVNGLGIQEGSYVFFFEQVGVLGPQALVIALISRLSRVLLSLVGGWLFMIGRNRRKVPIDLEQSEQKR